MGTEQDLYKYVPWHILITWPHTNETVRPARENSHTKINIQWSVLNTSEAYAKVVLLQSEWKHTLGNQLIATQLMGSSSRHMRRWETSGKTCLMSHWSTSTTAASVSQCASLHMGISGRITTRSSSTQQGNAVYQAWSILTLMQTLAESSMPSSVWWV